MDSEDPNKNQAFIEDTMKDYNREGKIRDLPELLDDESIDAYIASLNDWD